MNYQSPVDLIISEMNMRMDGEIFKAVQNVGVNVDRDELLKALQYDRGQYQKGYNDRDSEIIRCKDCIASNFAGLSYELWCGITGKRILPTDFCSNGRRKDSD